MEQSNRGRFFRKRISKNRYLSLTILENHISTTMVDERINTQPASLLGAALAKNSRPFFLICNLLLIHFLNILKNTHKKKIYTDIITLLCL